MSILLGRKIVSIRKIKKQPRCKVTFDNGEFYLFSIDLVVKHRMHKNQLIEEDRLESIQDEQKLIDCKQTAYVYASYKPRTEKQVKDKLRRKGFNEEHIQSAIDFLIEFDLLDDKKFAENFIINTLKRKPAGKYKIENELRLKGISGDIIDEVMGSTYPHDSVLNMAKTAAEKKLMSLKNKDELKKRIKLVTFLRNRGFDYDTIKAVLNELLPQD